MQCAMIDGTRSGYCVLPADGLKVDDWASLVRLNRRPVAMTDVETVPPLASEGPVGCLDTGTFPMVDGMTAYYLGGRPESLALIGGGQFEYMLLIFDPATARACIQVSYAYG
jgi:hypothetical protein